MKIKGMLPKRKSIIVTWLFSYISILFIPIIISGIVYVESAKTLESEINRANASIIRQMRLAVDKTLEDVERLRNDVTWNLKLQNLAYMKESDYSSFNYDLYKLTEELATYKNKYNSIDDFYVVFHNSGEVLVPNTRRDLNLIYSMLHEGGNLSYDQWLSILKEKHNMDSILIDKKDDSGKLRKTVAFLSSIPVSSQEPPAATVVIMVDEKRFMESVENIYVVEGGQVLITNREGNIMASSAQRDLSFSLEKDMFKDEEGLIYEEVEGKKYVLSHISSRKYGWRYVTVTPFSVFLKNSEYVRNLAVIGTMISLLLGVVITYLMVKKNYTPIGTLVNEISKKAGMSYTREWNEYRFIDEAISMTVDEKKKLNDILKQQRDVMRSVFLNRLLKGTIDSRIPVEESLSTYDMKFNKDSFAVILFFFEDMGKFLNENTEDQIQNYRLAQFILTNVVEELAGRKNSGYMVEVDNCMACIVNLDAGMSENKRELVEIAEEAIDFLKEKFGIQITAAISGIHKNISGIANAYSEALEAAEYKFVVGSRTLICYDDLPREETHPSRESYHFPMFVEQQLINSIKAGEDENAKEIINNVFAANFDNNSLTVQRAKVLVFDMVGTIVKAVVEMEDTVEEEFLENTSIISRLTACHTVRQMKEEMEKILDEVSKYIVSKRKSKKYQAKERQNIELVENAKKFIQENYFQLDLNISSISDKFGFSPSYLSKIFKECNGTGMLEYINSYRVERAKELIESGSYTINEVFCKVGFGDINSFIRTFKKYEGITPGKYKEIHGQYPCGK